MNPLYIVHYCHPDCTPLQSITRLPEAEAYALARALAKKSQDTAFGRMADFVHYYPLRIRTEQWLYGHFLALGGEPVTSHPLYFVLQGSDYLDAWFGRGGATRLSLYDIDARHISFTLGDSMSKMDKPERQDPLSKGELLARVDAAGGADAFLASLKPTYNYVEAQLWDDRYVKGQTE